jgi:hypothetical protein
MAGATRNGLVEIGDKYMRGWIVTAAILLILIVIVARVAHFLP